MVVYNGRCGVLLDPGVANMWRRGGERRHDSPDGRSLAVACAGRGFRGRVLSLVSVYGPVSGAAFDQERRRMFDCLSTEVGFRGVGEDSTLGRHAHGRRTRSGHWWNGLRERIFVFFCLLPDRVVEILGFTRRVGLAIQSIIFSVGREIIGFWVLLRYCLKMRLGNLGRHARIITRWRFGWQKVGFIALLQTPRRLRRPNWVALRGSSDGAVLARAALATELDRRVTEDKPTTWSDVVSLGVGVARAV